MTKQPWLCQTCGKMTDDPANHCLDLNAAYSKIDALERENAAMAKVVEAARAFYLNHEHLGWGGHEKIGEALAALAPEVKP